MSETFELYIAGTSLTGGDMTAVLHDADGVENRILHPNLENSIQLDWWVEGPGIPIINPAAQWHLEAHFESIGGPANEDVEPTPVDVAWSAGTLENPPKMTWSAPIPIQPDLFEPGVYKAVVLISFQVPDGSGGWTYTNMCGFCEIPMIRFIPLHVP